MSSTTPRSLKLLRASDYTVEVVEHWNAYTKTRHDLFNMFDIIAIKADEPGVLGIQTTSGSNASARVKKILANPLHKIWLAAGNRIVVHGWAKRGPRGKRKLWTCATYEVTRTHS